MPSAALANFYRKCANFCVEQVPKVIRRACCGLVNPPHRNGKWPKQRPSLPFEQIDDRLAASQLLVVCRGGIS